MAKAETVDSKVKAAKPAKAGSGKPAKPNVFARLAQYIRDVRSEMKRIVWPTRPEVVKAWVVVVVTLAFFVALTFVLDNILGAVVNSIASLKVGS